MKNKNKIKINDCCEMKYKDKVFQVKRNNLKYQTLRMQFDNYERDRNFQKEKARFGY